MGKMYYSVFSYCGNGQNIPLGIAIDKVNRGGTDFIFRKDIPQLRDDLSKRMVKNMLKNMREKIQEFQDDFLLYTKMFKNDFHFDKVRIVLTENHEATIEELMQEFFA